MRWTLRVLKWLGLGLYTILFLGTVVLWLRSLGHREGWRFERFEPHPQWNEGPLAGQGAFRLRYAHAIHGRLWLGSWTSAPVREFQPHTEYWHNPISADEAKRNFELCFQPGERPYLGGTARAWRFAGAGFSHTQIIVDPQTGRPRSVDFDLAIPFWMLTIVFGIWPAVFLLRRLLRRKRYAAGLCPACGYDLRATPDPAGPRLERCPECGNEVAGEGH